MVIACDTSFLFSLYASDAHSPKAVAWSARNTQAFYLNSLTYFEFGNAVRFSEFRGAIPLVPPLSIGLALRLPSLRAD